MSNTTLCDASAQSTTGSQRYLTYRSVEQIETNVQPPSGLPLTAASKDPTQAMRREVQSAARDRHVWPEWHPQRSGEDTRSMHWLEKRRQPSRLWWSAVFGHVNSGQTSPLLGHTSNKYRSSCHLNNMRVDSISCNLWPWQCQMPTFCFHAHIQMCYVFLTTGTFAVFGGTVGKWFTRSLHSSKIRGSLCVDFECFPPCSCPPPPPSAKNPC